MPAKPVVSGPAEPNPKQGYGRRGHHSQQALLLLLDYIMRISDYPRGEWCDTWDVLFWRVVPLHAEVLSRNPRTSSMVRMLRTKSHGLEAIMAKAE
jgi:hypothetical protein